MGAIRVAVNMVCGAIVAGGAHGTHMASKVTATRLAAPLRAKAVSQCSEKVDTVAFSCVSSFARLAYASSLLAIPQRRSSLN